LAERVGLTEASVSRIIGDLKDEGVVEETRRTAPYQGGPSAFLTLSNDRNVGALEIAGNRVHVGIGALTGDIRFSERFDLPDGADAAEVERVTAAAVSSLADNHRRRGVRLEHVAISVPGYHAGRAVNPIMALDPTKLLSILGADLPGVPVTVANSIVTRAVSHRVRMGVGHAGGPYLYVFVGHGVAGAFVDEFAESGNIAPCEIGHMVFAADGPRCRCGHRGCLEALVSTAAIATILNVAESDLLARGESWASDIRMSSKMRAELRERLRRLGLVVGNTLNLNSTRRVEIAGWPGGLRDEARAAIIEGIDAALFGGSEGVSLGFPNAEFGREPASGLASATFAFIRGGGETVR